VGGKPRVPSELRGQPGCLMTGSPAFFFLEEEP